MRLAATSVKELLKTWICLYADPGVPVLRSKRSRGDETVEGGCGNGYGSEICSSAASKDHGKIKEGLWTAVELSAKRGRVTSRTRVENCRRQRRERSDRLRSEDETFVELDVGDVNVVSQKWKDSLVQSKWSFVQ